MIWVSRIWNIIVSALLVDKLLTSYPFYSHMFLFKCPQLIIESTFVAIQVRTLFNTWADILAMCAPKLVSKSSSWCFQGTPPGRPTHERMGCSCGQEEEDGKKWVQCDLCSVWQHAQCAGHKYDEGMFTPLSELERGQQTVSTISSRLQ